MPTQQEQQLVALLTNIVERLDALEKANARPASPLSALADLLPPQSREGQGASSPVVFGANGRATGEQPLPDSPPVFEGFDTYDTRGAGRVPHRMAVSERPQPPAVPGPGVIEVPAGRPYTTAPAPEEPAIDGKQFIRCVGDDWVQVRSEDGRLLGAMPSFPEDVQVVYTELRQEMTVGMLAVRAVVVPYNRGIDPSKIVGFVPAPGLEAGPLTTGAVGRGANLENQDIGRRI